MINQVVLQTVKELKGAAKKNNAPLWSKLVEFASKPSSARRIVNLGQIDKFTKDNDVIMVPGKVLGTGNLSHKIILCSFSISNHGAQKVLQTGGKILSLTELIKKYPTGKGVILIG